MKVMKFVTILSLCSISAGALAQQLNPDSKKDILGVMNQAKDIKAKRRWVGNTGVYVEYEESKTGSGEYSPYLSGNFRRSKSMFSFEYDIYKTYNNQNDNYERTMMQMGGRYEYDSGKPYAFGAALAYRDETVVSSSSSATSGQSIHGYRPNLTASYNFGKMMGLYADALFNFERRAQHGSGTVIEYNDYEHELLGGMFVKMGKAHKVNLEYFHYIEDVTADYRDTLQQARISYAYKFMNGFELKPYYRHGLKYKSESYTSKYSRVHSYNAYRQYYGFKFKLPVNPRVTILGNYYYRNEQWTAVAGSGEKSKNKYKHYGMFGFNYSY